jgi:hypothetical protein
MGYLQYRGDSDVALDAGVEVRRRIEAIAHLGNSGSRESVEKLLELGERDAENVEILRAAGVALGTLFQSGVEVTEFDTRNLQKVTYDALCE